MFSKIKVLGIDETHPQYNCKRGSATPNQYIVTLYWWNDCYKAEIYLEPYFNN